MATKKATPPSSDLKSQIAALAKQQKALEGQLAKAAKGTMKALVRDFKVALKSNGLTLSDALAAMGSDPATKAAKPAKKRAKRGSKVKIEKPYKTGVIYKRPKGTETWVGGTKGRQPAWLRELIAGGRTFESLAAKK